MHAEKNLIKIGSSLAVIIPRDLAKIAGLKEGGKVRLDQAGEAIRLTAATRVVPVALCGIVAARGSGEKDFKAARRRASKAWAKRWKRT